MILTRNAAIKNIKYFCVSIETKTEKLNRNSIAVVSIFSWSSHNFFVTISKEMVFLLTHFLTMFVFIFIAAAYQHTVIVIMGELTIKKLQIVSSQGSAIMRIKTKHCESLIRGIFLPRWKLYWSF